jgi:ADP-ribosyl-[dinitrogen reductase] hydrolase
MSHLQAGIFGVAAGDALGVSYDGKKRDTFDVRTRTVNGARADTSVWSDDTSMTLAVLDSLIACSGEFSAKDMMERFAAWRYEGRYTPTGRAFGIGRTVSIALSRFREGTEPELCGSADVLSNGNGALMRMLPLALLKNPKRLQWIDAAGKLTHGHEISVMCCRLYEAVLTGLLNGLAPCAAVEAAVTPRPSWVPEYIVEKLLQLKILARASIGSSGFVVDTLTAALWCLINTSSYREAVETAVNLGRDTDTTASVTGGLAGVLYGIGGEKGIPEDWIAGLRRSADIAALCEKGESYMR